MTMRDGHEKGEIWWAELEKTLGRRSVLLLSRDESYRIRDSVIVAQITTKIRHITTEIYLDEKDGMPKKCVVNLDNLMTIKKFILRERICNVSAHKMVLAEQALKFALALR